MINLAAGKLKPAHPAVFIKLFTETGKELECTAARQIQALLHFD